MPRKPWLDATSEHYRKQQMRVLVAADFRCQFAQAKTYIPDTTLYDPDLYARKIAEWQKVKLTPLEGQCTVGCPETLLRKLQVHHIIERINFLPHQIEGHDISNLIVVCAAHHAQIHPHLSREIHVPLKTV